MKKMNIYFLLVLVIILGLLVFQIFTPFITTILIAFILWQLFKPIFNYLNAKIKRPALSSLISCFLVFLIIILPFLAIGSAFTKEAAEIYENVADSKNITESQKQLLESTESYLERIGISKEKVKEYVASVDLEDTIKKAVGISANFVQTAYQKISHFIFLLFVMFFILYYFFIDGDRFIKYAFHISPLKDKDEDLIMKRFMSMSKATLKGTLIIAIIQGTLGGITFWLLGINAALLWGVLMTLFAVIPLLGTAIIWLPASIWLIITGSWLKGLILILIGGVLISSIDNILRPKLVGKDTALHPLWIFLGTIGGIWKFGLIGFLIGPVVVTLFVAMLEIFERKFRAELEGFNKGKS